MSEFRIPDSGFRIPDSGFGIREAGNGKQGRCNSVRGKAENGLSGNVSSSRRKDKVTYGTSQAMHTV